MTIGDQSWKPAPRILCLVALHAKSATSSSYPPGSHTTVSMKSKLPDIMMWSSSQVNGEFDFASFPAQSVWESENG